jgi:Spy/CpxP family protein refolding chaperone
MTRVRVGIAAILGLMLVAGSARADTKDKPDKTIKPVTQDKDKPTRPPDRPPRERPGFGFPGANMPLLSERDLKALDLKDDQKEKVEKIVKDYNDKQATEFKKVRELLEKAREKGDPDAFREVQTKMRDLFEGFQKSRKEGLDKVRAVLNEEQTKKLDELARQPRFPGGQGPFGPGGPRGMFRPGQILPGPLQDQLRLTKEQKEELAKLQKDVDDKLKKLLTEEQRKMLERLSGGPGRPPGGFPPGGFDPPRPPRERD